MGLTLKELSHGFPDDIDLLLVGPNMKSMVLLSDAMGNQEVSNLTFRVASGVQEPVPNAAPPAAGGSYSPADYESTVDAFPLPAPQNGIGDNLANLWADGASGTWELYAVDDSLNDSGSLAGWGLDFWTLTPWADRLSFIYPADMPILSNHETISFTWDISVMVPGTYTAYLAVLAYLEDGTYRNGIGIPVTLTIHPFIAPDADQAGMVTR